MNEFGIKNPKATVADHGLKNVAAAYWNLEPAELYEETILRGQGMIASSGALAVDTGEFTEVILLGELFVPPSRPLIVGELHPRRCTLERGLTISFFSIITLNIITR